MQVFNYHSKKKEYGEHQEVVILNNITFKLNM